MKSADKPSARQLTASRRSVEGLAIWPLPSDECRRNGFTLIEVLLAIVIITGLLAVALFFYQQAAAFRTELLQEADRISATRLLMDRLTAELRCARRHSYFQVPLVGQSSSIQFITTSLPTRAAWNGEAFGRISYPETDLRFVSYKVASEGEGTNVLGLVRSEQPLVAFRTVSSVEARTESEATNTQQVLLTDQIRTLRFRYWNGSAWDDGWNDTRLPAAIEITLSANATPDAGGEEILDDSVDDSLFRRVVYLPGSAAPMPPGKAKPAEADMTTQSLEAPL